MEPVNMHSRLEMEFSQDILYKQAIKNKRLGHELIDQYMAELDELMTYTTTQFEEWYCDESRPEDFLIKASSMRRWLTDFNDYIEGTQLGRNWDLDYRAMFRLRMLLLFRKNGFKPSKLQEMLGLKVYVQPGDVDYPDGNDSPTSAANPSPDQQVMLEQILLKILHEQHSNQPESLPGNIEKRLNDLESSSKENKEEIEALRESLQEQQQLMQQQDQLLNMMSDIHEMYFSFQQHSDPERFRQDLSKLRQTDQPAYFNAMMKIVKESKTAATEQNNGFWSKLRSKLGMKG